MNITLIKEISLLIGIWIAIYGIDSWRREYIGKRQMELAEKVLSLFYEARDIIKYIRNTLSFIGEGSSRKKSEKESETETEVLNRAHIIFERYDKHSELFNKLRTYRY